MKRQLKSGQRGLSFIGLLVVGGLLASLGVMLAQAFPTYVEYMAVKKAVVKAGEGNTVAEVRSLFDKAAQIDDITSISGKELDITKEGDKVVVSFAYSREIHMAGPAYLLLKYSGRSR
jgi:Domain of unknown function (DUF4845)